MGYGGMAARPAPARAVDTTDVLGRRIGAMIIDSVMLYIAFAVVGSAIAASDRRSGTAYLVFLGFTLAYFLICEGAAGQTLGKKLVGIRVVSVDGTRASWGQVLGRTLLRPVDGLPFAYILGLVVALVNGRRQRIGDVAAHTTVVPAE